MNHQKLFLEANYYWDVNRLHKVITLHRHETTGKCKKLTDLEATIREHPNSAISTIVRSK
jgi:hypothetical protein